MALGKRGWEFETLRKLALKSPPVASFDLKALLDDLIISQIFLGCRVSGSGFKAQGGAAAALTLEQARRGCARPVRGETYY